MSDYIIMTDSSCDLPEEVANKIELSYVPLKAYIDNKEYINDLGWHSIGSADGFYDGLRNGAVATTSAPSIDDFRSVMEPALKSGKDILYVGFSSALSSCFSTGKMTASMLSEEYPERKIICIDSLAASLGQGLLVYLTCQKKAEGATLEEAASFVEEQMFHICHWFSVGDLMYLKRGGRISSTAAIAGTLLNIKPILHMDNEGRLTPVTKVRGTKAYYAKIAEIIRNTGIDIENQTLFFVHGGCEESIKPFVEYLQENFRFKDYVINYIGPVIGAHAGPDTTSVFFVGTER